MTELQRLNGPGCQSPKDKADVLVHAHKLVVGQSAQSMKFMANTVSRCLSEVAKHPFTT